MKYLYPKNPKIVEGLDGHKYLIINSTCLEDVVRELNITLHDVDGFENAVRLAPDFEGDVS